MNRRLCVRVVSIFACVALVSSAVAQALPGGGTPGGGTPPGPSALPGATAGAGAPASGTPASGTPASGTPGSGTPSTAAGPTIPVTAETAADANSFAPAIRAFIQYQLSMLNGPDFPAQTAARDALRKTLTRGSTPSYYAVFCKEWSAAAAPLLSKTPPVPVTVRLNIGIVTSTLTDNGQTMEASALPSAETLVNLLLNDPSSSGSVALWGVKAARPLVMLQMQKPDVGGKSAISTSTLVANIVTAVKNHQPQAPRTKESEDKTEVTGFIVEDAYADLAVKEIPSLTDDSVKKFQPPLVDPILDILALRVAQYKDGAVPSPGAERTISTFLSSQYRNVPLATQKRMVQLLVNLETYAGQRADQYINNKADLAQLRGMLAYVASALKVIAGDKTVDNGLGWITTMPPAATPPEIAAHTKLVAGVIRPVLNWVMNPPEIPVMDPPPLIKAPGAAPTPAGTTSPPKPPTG